MNSTHNTNADKKADELALPKEVSFEEAGYAVTFDKPFYPKVCYYATLTDAMQVSDFCQKYSKPAVGDAVEMKITVSQIIQKHQSTDPWF